MAFLPVNMQDMKERGWPEADFVLVTGDAYVDHPSFGTAIISRVLEERGFRVAVLPQPDWRGTKDFMRFGRPTIGFLVNSGNIDSMVAHYTSAKRRRSEDAYSPGRRAGLRPDRAVTVYCRKIREAYGGVPIIIGGLEASLRRFAHYDYWDDAVRPSILVESGADLLVYGMGEKQTAEIAERLCEGEPVRELRGIRGTCCLAPADTEIDGIMLPPFGKLKNSKRDYAESCRIEQNEQDPVRGRRLYQRYESGMLVQEPPMEPLTTEELDRVFELPYERMYHPMYEPMGGVPAIEEVEFSIMHNRGCFGACNFCSLAFHQGRMVTCRSEESVIREAEAFTRNPRFKGYIHDVGGPTANFRRPACRGQLKKGLCKKKKCLAPEPCPAVEADHSEYLHLLRRLRKLPGVKKVFIRSGIRYDYMMLDPSDEFFRELVKYHVSGQLKVAPEHCSNAVLEKMGKPRIGVYEKFREKYFAFSKEAGKEQYLVPYLMSSHPGSTLADAVALAQFLKKEGIRPQQVQDFYPTPGTVSTCMFYTGLDPFTMKEVYVPRTAEEKGLQRALLQYFRPENRQKVLLALRKAGRMDLVGRRTECLLAPDPKPAGKQGQNQKGRGKKRWQEKRKNTRG